MRRIGVVHLGQGVGDGRVLGGWINQITQTLKIGHSQNFQVNMSLIIIHPYFKNVLHRAFNSLFQSMYNQFCDSPNIVVTIPIIVTVFA